MSSAASELAGRFLTDHLIRFVRTLRAAGIRVGPAQLLDALHALVAIGIRSRGDVANGLATVLLKNPEDRPVFNQAFHVFFRNPELLSRLSALLLPSTDQDSPGATDTPGARRLLEALQGDEPQTQRDSHTESQIDSARSASKREVLREKDFAQMSLTELEQAQRLLRADLVALNPIATRRYRPAAAGSDVDLRASMRRACRSGGELLQLAKRQRRTRTPPLVILCDISGSMAAYSRMFLHLAHGLTRRYTSVSTFLFGTRLTNISRALKDRDIDRAMNEVALEVPDWDGGTRISRSLHVFNHEWGRRLLSRRAIVLLMSDGLERDPDDSLGAEAERLAANAWRVLWLNPLLSYSGFAPAAGGIRQLLPAVDRLLPAHNVASLGDLRALLERASIGAPGRRVR